MKKDCDIIVIGAGAAGIAAARELDARGVRVIILEANNRIGGRILTLHNASLPVPIELGAEFLHGTSDHTWNIIREMALPTARILGDYWWSKKGRLHSRSDFDELWGSVVSEMKKFRRRKDRSFKDFVELCCLGNRWKEARDLGIGYVQGFHAAPIGEVGIHSLIQSEIASDRVEGEREFRLVQGYDGIIRAISEKFSNRIAIELNSPVCSIRWKRNSVEARAIHHGRSNTFRANGCIITLPLGILKLREASKGFVKFDPELPSKMTAARQLGIAKVIKVVLHFREPIWRTKEGLLKFKDKPELDEVAFILSRDPMMPTWWTQSPLQAPILTGWAGGPAAERLQHHNKESLIVEAMDALSRILATRPSLLKRYLIGAYTHNWQTDQYARGAYTFISPGCLDAQEELAAPVERTLFFAGEATETNGDFGTVHGAIATGKRAARQVLRSEL